MINGYLLEKRFKAAKRSHSLQKKSEQDECNHNKYNQQLREIYDKRIERIIEYRKQRPLEPVGNFVLNETFFREKNNTHYKMSTTNGNAIPFLKQSFNSSTRAQVQHSIEKNKIFSPEYTEAKPFEFRQRRTDKEIQPGLRFKNDLKFRQTRCDRDDRCDTQDESNDSRPTYTQLNRSLDTTRYNVNLKADSNKPRYNIHHTRRLSAGTGMLQSPVEASSIAGTTTNKTKTVLDSMPFKSIQTRTLHLPRSRIEFKKKRYEAVNLSELDDEMLQGEDLSFEHIIPVNSPRNVATLRNAKEVLKAADLIK